MRLKGCRVSGCERKHFALGCCNMHYSRLRTHGDPTAISPNFFGKGKVKSPLGHSHSRTPRQCVTCGAEFSVMVKRVSLGGGLYCRNKNCNPAYAPKAPKQTVIRRANLKKNYGLTIAQYDDMAAAQKGLCAICCLPPRGKGHHGRLFVDHDHATGKVRGLLCGSCNIALGLFQDDVALLCLAEKYLSRFKKRWR